ncbi:hypothetical protein JIN84_08800 [Luteolibacter yonseiensis]|uniref:Uncharacterized protein n=1 Tax=Luteolibacter yonseiensis TaxID=1144680 RepID=A0A934R456_9BACT|nr:hypothetical protein [Luteolibacter yonseiensis]MBK1815713.1 hypothetical protein [Luteolibacter yonseiensis]
MKKSKTYFIVIVVACVSATYLLTRHPTRQDAAAGDAKSGPQAVFQGENRTKAADRNDRPPDKPKRWSVGEKLKATLPPDLDPEHAKKLLAAFIAGNPDLNEQSRHAMLLMEKLCDNGFSEEAEDLIPDERGLLRDNLIRHYFAYADLPSDQLLSKIERFTELGDTLDGFRSYLRRFSPADIPEAASSERVRELLKKVNPNRWQVHLNQAVRNEFMMKLGESENSDFVIINTAADMNAKGLLGSEEYLEVVNADKTASAFDKWERMRLVNMSSLQDKDHQQQFMRDRGNFISGMLAEDAPQTLSLMLKSQSEYKDRDLASAIGRWVDIHSSEPSEWFVANRDRMSHRQRTVAADTFVGKALQAGEFEGARLWTKEIPDKARRAEALEMIAAKEAGKQKPRAGN